MHRKTHTKYVHSSPTPLEKIHGRLPPLRVGDLVLIRHKHGNGTISRWLLRRITMSYWDHVAIVIFNKDTVGGYATDMIAESKQDTLLRSIHRGVEIHRLDKYLTNPKKYDIGIRRFKWLTPEQQERVRSFILMNVDTPYYPLNPFKLFIAMLSSKMRRWILARQRFSCSGLIQKAFYEAMDWEERSKVVFREHGYTPIQLQDITSPADIAKSETCEWIWNRH